MSCENNKPNDMTLEEAKEIMKSPYIENITMDELRKAERIGVQLKPRVIRLIEVTDEHKIPDFANRKCLIKYKNYKHEEWLIADEHHDDCFWFQDNSLPCGDDWVQYYGFLDGV